MRRTQRLALLVLLSLAGALVACRTRSESAADPAASDSNLVLPQGSATDTADSPITPAPTIPKRQFAPAPCDFVVPGGYDVICGYLTVPENREKEAVGKQTRDIKLHVALFMHRAARAAPDPVVYLAGGPGSSALASASALAPLFAAISAERELILLDQRGTGFSLPSLNCPEHSQAVELSWRLNADVERALKLEMIALLTCRNRLLAEGIDLGGYTTAANAADVVDLMHALGYDEWNIVGGSYGTRLGLTILRDFASEGQVRSAILDSVFPHQANVAVETMAAVTQALEHVFDRCAADTACNRQYPDLPRRFDELLGRLKASPMEVSIRNPFNQRQQTYRVDDSQLLLIMEDTLYRQRLIYKIPSAIEDALGDRPLDFNLLARAYAQQLLEEFAERDFSEGMHYSVMCAEEYPYLDGEPIMMPESNLVQDYEYNAALRRGWFEELCEAWQMPPADPVENAAVTSDVPALILAGAYDPRTPPAWGRASLWTLANGYYVEHPAGSHGVLSMDACTMTVARRFLDDPMADPYNDCIDQWQEISFK